MRYVAAYLLATLGGNDAPTLKDIKAILASVGIDCDQKLAEVVIKNLAGKNVNDVIAAGSEKLASVPSGGAAPAAAAAAPAAEEKKEEKKEEKEEEESDDDMGFGLFD